MSPVVGKSSSKPAIRKYWKRNLAQGGEQRVDTGKWMLTHNRFNIPPLVATALSSSVSPEFILWTT